MSLNNKLGTILSLLQKYIHGYPAKGFAKHTLGTTANLARKV